MKPAKYTNLLTLSDQDFKQAMEGARANAQKMDVSILAFLGLYLDSATIGKVHDRETKLAQAEVAKLAQVKSATERYLAATKGLTGASLVAEWLEYKKAVGDATYEQVWTICFSSGLNLDDETEKVQAEMDLLSGDLGKKYQVRYVESESERNYSTKEFGSMVAVEFLAFTGEDEQLNVYRREFDGEKYLFVSNLPVPEEDLRKLALWHYAG